MEKALPSGRVVRFPLRSIKRPSGRKRVRRLAPASRGVTVPLGVCDAVRTGYSVHRSLLGVELTLSPSRSSGLHLSPLFEKSGSSSYRLQLPYRDPDRHGPSRRSGKPRWCSELLPWGSAPFQRRRTRESAYRRIPCPTPPSSAFLRPLRDSSSRALAALFHAADAHRVSTLQSVPLPHSSTRLITRRYPLGVSPLVRRLTAAPSGRSA